MNKLKGKCDINIGGEQRTLVFDMNAYALFCEKMDIDISEFGDIFTSSKRLRGTMALIWAGLHSYAERLGKVDFSYYDVCDWIDEVSSDDLAKVMDTLVKSRSLENDSNGGLSRTSSGSDEGSKKK